MNMQVYYSPKSKLIALLLCFFLGSIGLHRIYIGRVQSGLLMLGALVIGGITAGLGIGSVIIGLVNLWAFIDFVCLCIGKLTDADGRPLKFNF